LAMQFVRAPKQFNVILTSNLLGDILSDEVAMLTGSLAILPFAGIGEPDGLGLYAPIHRSAPDFAGRGMANPCASILSLANAPRYSLGRPDLANDLDRGTSVALEDGTLSVDLGNTVTTSEMGVAILATLSAIEPAEPGAGAMNAHVARTKYSNDTASGEELIDRAKALRAHAVVGCVTGRAHKTQALRREASGEPLETGVVIDACRGNH